MTLKVRHDPGWSEDETHEQRQAREDLIERRNDEFTRRSRWYTTYNAALTGLRAAHFSLHFARADQEHFGIAGIIPAEVLHKFAAADADALHGSIA